MNTAPRVRQLLLALCALSCGGPGYAQEIPPAGELLTRLAAADEETRLDAAVNLGGLFTLVPGAATPAAVAALATALQQDRSPLLRALAARALEMSGSERAAPALLAALPREKDLAARKAIVYALARYPAPQVTQALLSLLKDKYVEIRATAAYALAELADPAAAGALIDTLAVRRKDEDAFLRREAARGLGLTGAPAAVGPLVAALAGDKSEDVRREAAEALGRVANPRDAAAVAALRDATRAADPYLNFAAEVALARIQARDQKSIQ